MGDPLHLFLGAVWQVGRERDLPDLVDDVLARFWTLLREAQDAEVDLRDDTPADAFVCDWGVADG
ncbi:MAG: hypothetical protein AB1679_17915 [Actinomycetota bacterium]